jgi:hypothetical protein
MSSLNTVRRRAMKPGREFQALFPTLEELLINGTPREIRKYRKYLLDRADDLRVYAFTAAGGSADDTILPWRELEKEEEIGLSYVLFLWQYAAVYEHWAKVLEDPRKHLNWCGGVSFDD